MNTLEYRAERIRHGKSAKYMANALNLTYDSYIKKERGVIRFNIPQIIIATRELELDADKINIIFFDGELPIGNYKKSS